MAEALPPPGRWYASGFCHELEKRPRRHLGICRRPFGQVADATLGGSRLRLDVVAADGDAAGGCVEEARDDAHRRRLAGAVRAEESEHLARLHLEGQIIYGAQRTILFGQPLTVDHASIPFRDDGRDSGAGSALNSA